MNQLKRVAVLLAFVLAGFSSSASAGEFRNPVALAQEYLGLHQERDRSVLKDLLEVDPRRIPWCAAFVNRILEMSGFSGSDSLMARSFLSVGSRVRSPQQGDIVVLTRGSNPASGHVGFYMGEEGGYVIVLGGNQQRAVSISQYHKSRVLGYRRIAVSGRKPAQERPVCNPGSPDYIWTQGCPS